ncbi:Quinone oxidoreductase PIG3 [Lonchura striata]|uniref:Quinone oxidoreductase PIG3 n=1 Tax=Lonchura striata TaxID=40157 RepID=A0A218UPY7_9PASE|nr:Quinone oxidoreductase PIG3 [Lonchura striata domestica]
MFAAYFDCPGGPENLYMKEVMKPNPGEGEVLVKVSASALNRADLLQRRGKYPPPKGASDILGLEAAGSVAGLGPGCSGRWQIGDAVMALLPGGGQAQYVTVHEGLLMPIPKDMTFIQAAAIPEAWLTAFQLLHFVGKVQEGERVLIHAGASGVGMAAIQLVRLAKAIPIVTAGTQEKLEATANAGAAAGFNYKNEDFSEKVLEFTQGSGVDIILDCVGASYWEKNLNCLRTDGRWIIYGLLSGGEVHGDLLSRLISKRASIHTSLLRSRDKEASSGYQQCMRFDLKIYDHFENFLLKPVLSTFFVRMSECLPEGCVPFTRRAVDTRVSERLAVTLQLFSPQHKQRLVRAFTEQALPHFCGGAAPRLRPVVDSVYPLHAIAEAHRAMEENRNIGKIAIEIPACVKKGPPQ